MAPTRGWTQRGHRLPGQTPHGHWKTMILLAALRYDRIDRALGASTGRSMTRLSKSMLGKYSDPRCDPAISSSWTFSAATRERQSAPPSERAAAGMAGLTFSSKTCPTPGSILQAELGTVGSSRARSEPPGQAFFTGPKPIVGAPWHTVAASGARQHQRPEILASFIGVDRTARLSSVRGPCLAGGTMCPGEMRLSRRLLL